MQGIDMLKSQDFLVLIKLISLHREFLRRTHYPTSSLIELFDGGEQSLNVEKDIHFYEILSVRGLGASLGISKTEIGASLRRCVESNLLFISNSYDAVSLANFNWKVNKKAIFNLIKHGVPYLYPPKLLGLDIGIPTGFSGPALLEEVTSAGNTKIIWSSEYGDVYGQVLEPIYKTVAFASYQDEFVYNCFTLIDAYRLGKAREKEIAINLLEKTILRD